MNGIVGTFKSYVPIATDLYFRGNNIAGFQASGSNGLYLVKLKPINLTKFFELPHQKMYLA